MRGDGLLWFVRTKVCMRVLQGGRTKSPFSGRIHCQLWNLGPSFVTMRVHTRVLLKGVEGVGFLSSPVTIF